MSFNYGNALEFLKDNNWQDTSEAGLRNANRIINAANQALHTAGQWDFDKRYARLVFEAMKTDGTLAITQGATAVVGTGTSFAAGDVLKQLRVAGSPLSHEVTARASVTGITIEAFRDATVATGTYQLTQPRVAAPTRFRSLAKPSSGDGLYELKPLNDVRDLWRLRRQERSTGTPRYYAIEWKGASTPVPYLWIYPDPIVLYVIDLAHYQWPDKVSADADVFGLPDTEAAHHVLQLFITAYLEKEQKNANWVASLQYAESEAKRILPQFRAHDEDGRREAHVDCDEAADSYKAQLSSGISGYGDS